jgi:hypothetical protein
MTNTKPLLLVDVDGPLNPWRAKSHRRPEGYSTYRYSPAGWTDKPFRVWLNEDHGAMLTQYAKNAGMELAWATTWMDEANSWVGPKIGLTENWPVVQFDRFDLRNKNVWKFKGVGDFAKNRDLVWMDDDFKFFKREGQAFMLGRRHGRTKLHYVDPSIGITQQDLNEINIWLLTGS